MSQSVSLPPPGGATHLARATRSRRGMAPMALGTAAAMVPASLLTAALRGHLISNRIETQAGLIATFLCLFALFWVPVSVWLLWNSMRNAPDAAIEETERRLQQQLELFRATRRDALTGLQSRLAFHDGLSAHFAQSRPFGLLLIDLDRFNEINTLHGDGAGNEVLRALADRLRTIAGQREHAARLDGDEFALLLDQPQDVKDIEQAAIRALRTLTEPYPVAGQLANVQISIGIACAPQHGDNAETILRAARIALASAKDAGGGTWRVCGADLSEQLMLRKQFRGEIFQAIESGQIIPHYQPIMRLPHGEIAKFEVLARWNHPRLGLLTPDQFIPLAEELGLAGQISMALLRQVALDSQIWPNWCRYAINVSAGQMRELISMICNQPGEWQRRMDLTQLDVEITEDALLRDRDMARELIEALHEQGARAGLDNFGRGYSNLSHLLDMPFDSIKISKSFIQHLLEDPRAEACVMSMLWLGHGLGIDMVADGVETPEIAERLAQMGCHYAQGFLYAHPMPADEISQLLNIPARRREMEYN